MRYSMNPWKCEDCGKRYSYDEFFKLIKDDKHMHCECGYVFTHGMWYLLDYVEREEVGEIGTVTFRISTIYLELIFSDDEQYETMTFPEDDKIDIYYCKRYKTRAEAEKGHQRAIELIKSSKFNITTNPDGEHYLEIIYGK